MIDNAHRPYLRSIVMICSVSLITAIVAGCTAAPVTPNKKNDPFDIKDAPPGVSVIYFFRPTLDQVDRGANPILAVNNQPVATLVHEAYTAVSLKPGVHRVSLAPGATDSADWNQIAEFSAADGVTYFVVIWHQKQATSAYTPFRDLYGFVGNIVIDVLNAPRGPNPPRMELVDRSTAEYELRGLQFVAPKDNSMAVR